MELEAIVERMSGANSADALLALGELNPADAARALKSVTPDRAHQLWVSMPATTRNQIHTVLLPDFPQQWERNLAFPEGTVARLMEPPLAVFRRDALIRDVLVDLRQLIQNEFITYLYVTDEGGRLEGLVVMRDLLFAGPEQRLSDVMIKKPFALKAQCKLMDAMHEVLVKHFPVYPVVNDAGILVGLVRGFRLFEAQAIEISAQAGSMVGVEKEERVSTPWLKSFRYRHPWLQLNLLTAFIAGAVVNCFQGTIDQIVVLASFLPVLAGQSGNTGCQALAVTLRGMTLGELSRSRVPRVVVKEALLGITNGMLVGLSAALGMYVLASSQGNPHALTLSAIVLVAMMGSCCISGLSGALVPLALRKMGADPATASSIFLTTATDVASMGLLLSLATAILL